MKKLILFICAVFLIFGVLGVAKADLTVIGTATYDGTDYNLIYEDDSIYGGLVWLDYTKDGAPQTVQKSWASGLGASLTVSLYPEYTTTIDWSTGWRLPSAGINPQCAYDQSTSEMGHLYYVSLGLQLGGVSDDTLLLPFENLLKSLFWTDDTRDSWPIPEAWYFAFSDGLQCYYPAPAAFYAIAVHPFEVSINQPPTADSGGPYLVTVNDTIPIDGSGFDPDGDDLTYLWTALSGSFDDETAEDPSYTAGSEAGIFDLTLTVTDPGDLSDSDATFVVVYDPDGGFVTGGGWIDSPEGAYSEDPQLTGKANFGFVSKYKKGDTIPTGNTEFQFQAGNLNFHSDSYEWLVVTGSNYAKFKGSGTINGEGDYKFKLWAGDNDPDTFRIKIWEEDEFENEIVIYDNGMDQAIGGGSIVVHEAKK
jgi:hypothetical protein